MKRLIWGTPASTFRFYPNPSSLKHAERSRPPTQLTDPWQGGVFTLRRRQPQRTPQPLPQDWQTGVLGSSPNATLTCFEHSGTSSHLWGLGFSICERGCWAHWQSLQSLTVKSKARL